MIFALAWLPFGCLIWAFLSNLLMTVMLQQLYVTYKEQTFTP